MRGHRTTTTQLLCGFRANADCARGSAVHAAAATHAERRTCQSNLVWRARPARFFRCGASTAPLLTKRFTRRGDYSPPSPARMAAQKCTAKPVVVAQKSIWEKAVQCIDRCPASLYLVRFVDGVGLHVGV